MFLIIVILMMIALIWAAGEALYGIGVIIGVALLLIGLAVGIGKAIHDDRKHRR